MDRSARGPTKDGRNGMPTVTVRGYTVTGGVINVDGGIREDLPGEAEGDIPVLGIWDRAGFGVTDEPSVDPVREGEIT